MYIFFGNFHKIIAIHLLDKIGLNCSRNEKAPFTMVFVSAMISIIYNNRCRQYANPI